jgi:uncharacterized protein (DUF1778 family)
METKTINLRDLPEDFVRKAKAYAALSGMTLKDFVIQAVQTAMQDEIRPTAPNAAFVDNKKRRKK